MKWGHRRNVEAYGAGLKAVDDYLPLLMEAMDDDTLLVITADHGCDPTHTGSDHTREHIPVLLWHRGIIPGPAGIRETFGDVGATILHALGLRRPKWEPAFCDKRKHGSNRAHPIWVRRFCSG